MTTARESMDRLDKMARELGERSTQLAKVTRDLEPVHREYTSFVDDFEIGLWKKHQDEDAKFPSAAMRLKLAEREMDPALLGRHYGLEESRKRLMKRISDLRAEIEAERSILSALKTEMEATSR